MQDMIWKDQETRGQRDTRIWEEGEWGHGSASQPASSGRTWRGEACGSSKYTEGGREIISGWWTEVLGRRSQDHGGAPESSLFRIWRIFSREPGGAVPGLQNDPTEQGGWSPSPPAHLTGPVRAWVLVLRTLSRCWRHADEKPCLHCEHGAKNDRTPKES